MRLRKAFADGVRRHRGTKGWSQKALADAMGVTVPYISEVENARGNPTLAQVERVAGALEVDPLEIFAGPPTPENVRIVARPQRKARVRVHDHSGPCPYEGCTTGLPALEQFNGFCSAYCRVAEEQAKKGKR